MIARLAATCAGARKAGSRAAIAVSARSAIAGASLGVASRCGRSVTSARSAPGYAALSGGRSRLSPTFLVDARPATARAFGSSRQLARPSAGGNTAMDYDIIVRGGTVVDGTRLPRYRAD